MPLEIKEFCLETFLPEIRVATSAIRPLPEEERTKLVGNFLGTVMKLGYGGIWEVCEYNHDYKLNRSPYTKT